MVNALSKKIRQAKTFDNVINSALWHLTQRDLTESQLRIKLGNKTSNSEWVDQAISRMFELGYLKSDIEFAEQFIQRSFFGDYGSGYIVTKLKKYGLDEQLINKTVNSVKVERDIDEQAILNNYVLSYYHVFNDSRERLYNTLCKRGFSLAQVQLAVSLHPQACNLKTKLELKAETVDLEKEVMKYARRGKGLIAIRSEFIKRKVNIESLDECVNRLINEEGLDFYDNCLKQLSQKAYDLKDYRDRGKAYGMLSRKGYSSDEIKYALEEMGNS